MIAHLHKRNKTLTNEQKQYWAAIRTLNKEVKELREKLEEKGCQKKKQEAKAMVEKELTCTDVVSVKDFPKVKLESFCNSKVPELGKLCVPWFMRVLGFL